MYEAFLEYLQKEPSYKSGRSISASSKKYADAIFIISEEMMATGVIERSLYNVTDPNELHKLIIAIFDNQIFIDKNKRGNKMYSNALDHYLHFLKLKKL